MAKKRELIQFEITNNTDCDFTLPLFKQGVPSINATTKYSWNITTETYSCGSASIVINGETIIFTFSPDITGLIIGLNALGYGFFCVEIIGGDTFLYVKDDTNVYGNFQVCVLNCPPLLIEFTNIADAIALVGDVNDVNNWNTYFQLPTYGSPFTSVVVVLDEVSLYGGLNITLRRFLFSPAKSSAIDIVRVIDDANCVIEIEDNTFTNCINLSEVEFPYCTRIDDSIPTLTSGAFQGCSSLGVVYFPRLIYAGDTAFNGGVPLTTTNFGELQTAGEYCFFSSPTTSLSLPSLLLARLGCFQDCNQLTTLSLPLTTSIGDSALQSCTALTTISFPSCTSLGSSVGDNNVFLNINGNIITLTVRSALLTNNGGNPDGDIQYLQANNTVTIISV
jgi:hypothetical protein